MNQQHGKWTVWDQTMTPPRIIVAANSGEVERDAALQLQKYLARALGKPVPLQETPTLSNENLVPYSGASIFVGQLKNVSALKKLATALSDESYVIDVLPKTKEIILGGASEMATQFAVSDFLGQFCGVRWYMPNDLFEVVPKVDKLSLPTGRIIEQPAFSPRTFGYAWQKAPLGYVGEKVPGLNVDRWLVRNRLSSDGRGRAMHFNHNLMHIVPSEKYGKTHPEYFPFVNGQRQIPLPTQDVGWQPELTNPDVVQLAIEAGRKHFRENTQPWQWFSLSVTDGNGWSESPETKKAAGAPYLFRGRAMQSDMYYAFVEKVAKALEVEFPNRRISLIAYLDVEAPPRNIKRLPKNVNVLITQDTSQYHDAKYRAEDEALLKQWMEVANGNVYRYDYHGLGWIAPRSYPLLVAEDARRSQQLGLKGFYTEDVPLWPVMSPMLYTITKSWWSPEQNANVLLDEYCKTLFGSASTPMREYIRYLEVVWDKPRPGRFFEGISDVPSQTAIYSAADRKKLDSLMDQAQRLAKSDSVLVQRRVNFFAQGWKLASFYLQENEIDQTLQGTIQTVSEAERRVKQSTQLLELVDEHDQFYAQFLKKEEALSGTYHWVFDVIGREGGSRASQRSVAASTILDSLNVIAKTDRKRVEEIISSWRAGGTGEAEKTLQFIANWFASAQPENLINNPALTSANKVVDWESGVPSGWDFWTPTPATPKFREGMLRFENATIAVYAMQNIPVKAGTVLRLAATYRCSEQYKGRIVLRCRWRDDKGQWHPNGGEAFDVSASAPPRGTNSTAQILGKVPEGAVTAVILIGAENQSAGDWVEFEQPYFGVRE